MPLLIGMPAPAPALRKSFTNIVWLMLDEPSHKRRLQPSGKILEEVKEMYGNGIKERIKYLYKDFGQGAAVYLPNERQIASVKAVLRVMFEYLDGLLRSIPKQTNKKIIDSQELINFVLPKSNSADHMFLKALLSTQVVVTYLEENA